MNIHSQTFEGLQNSNKTNMTESTMADITFQQSSKVGPKIKDKQELKLEFEFRFGDREILPQAQQIMPKVNNFTNNIVQQKIIEMNFGEQNSSSQDLYKQIDERKKQVKQLISAPSLRQKFSYLLPIQLRLKLGHLHYKLINKMLSIDRCIIIINKNDIQKPMTFQQVEKYVQLIQQSVNQNDFGQIIFLNNLQRIYFIEWIRKEILAQYQLSLRLPFNRSYNQDGRKCFFRKAICKFLIIRYKQYLISLGIKTTESTISNIIQWQNNFNVDDIQIPCQKYPDNPYLHQDAINQNSSNNKQNNEKKRNNTKQIGNQKQSKTNNELQQTSKRKSFKNMLHGMVKSRQQNYKKKKNERVIQKTPIKSETLIKFCQQSCLLYTQRGVSTIFKINLLNSIKKKMSSQLSTIQIEQILNQILKLNVNFMTKIQTEMGDMIRITRQNYNQVIQIISSI